MMRDASNPRVAKMAKHSSDAQWVTIDPETLHDHAKQAYSEYKIAYRVMKEQRERFETLMQAGVPEGSRMVLGYNFGKLSAAIVPDDRKPKAVKSTQSLAEFLAAQAAGGRQA